MIDKDFRLLSPQLTTDILKAAGDILNSINPNDVRNVSTSIELQKFDLVGNDYVIREKDKKSRPRFYCYTFTVVKWNRNGEYIDRTTYVYNKENKKFI